LFKYKERIKEKKDSLYVIDNIKWQQGVLQFHSDYTRAATGWRLTKIRKTLTKTPPSS
jgi:hypothetical protein